MEMVSVLVPYEFIRERTSTTWREILFGLENKIIGREVAIERAVEQCADEVPTGALLELAIASDKEPVIVHVQLLANGEQARDDDAVLEKWLYLVLAWLYECRHEVSEPLERIAGIYADFGYPKQIEGFIYYMPMIGPDLGSVEANVERLFKNWRQFIDEERVKYQGSIRLK